MATGTIRKVVSSDDLSGKLDASKITTGTFGCYPSNGIINVSSNYTGTLPTDGHVLFTPYNFGTDRGFLTFFFDENGKLYCYGNKTMGKVNVRWMKYTP